MRNVLTQLIMGNDPCWCYARSTFQMCLWAILGLVGFGPRTLVVGGFDLAAILEQLIGHPFQLHDIQWFQDMMCAWQGGRGQTDAAALLVLLIRRMGNDEWKCGWEKRLLESDNPLRVRVMETVAGCSPIRLQFQMGADFVTETPIARLIQRWSQEWGMQQALTAEFPLVCLQIDRFCKDDQNNLEKLFVDVQDYEKTIYLPVYTSSHLDVKMVPYVMISALIHIGSVTGGHYQALLRMGGAYGTGGPSWLLTDDDSKMQHVAPLPSWTGSALTLMWVCRAEFVSLPSHVYEPTAASIPANGTILDLVT